MVLPLNGFGSASFVLIYGQFVLAKGACVGIIADAIYMGIVKNSVEGLAS